VISFGAFHLRQCFDTLTWTSGRAYVADKKLCRYLQKPDDQLPDSTKYNSSSTGQNKTQRLCTDSGCLRMGPRSCYRFRTSLVQVRNFNQCNFQYTRISLTFIKSNSQVHDLSRFSRQVVILQRFSFVTARTEPQLAVVYKENSL